MRKLWAFFFVLFMISFSVQAKEFFPQYTDDLEEKQIWIQVYFKPNSNIAIMNFRVWFKYPPAKVFKVLTDTESFKKKMNNYNDSRTLTKQLAKKILDANPKNADDVRAAIGTNHLTSDYNRQVGHNWTDYIFFDFNFPWPLTDKWVVEKLRVDESNHKKGEYKLDFKMLAGNFKANFGHWELVPVPNHKGWSEFRGSYETDTGISVPKFVTKKGTKLGFKKDIASYRKILKSMK